MSISVTGLGSGLQYDEWIEKLVELKQAKIDVVNDKVKAVNKQKTTLDSIETEYKELLQSIKSFTGALSADDVFKQKAVTSSSEAVSASVAAGASVQDVKVTVSQLATATKASSATPAASYVDNSTVMSKVAEGAFKEGTFSVYVGGAKSTISISKDETMESVLTKLNDIEGVSATLTDGKLSIEAESGFNLTSVGSSTDTSNFSNVMSLTRNSTTGAYSSSKAVFDTDSSAALMSTEFAKGAITAGTFTIGDKTFTVDATKSLDSIIEEINSSDAGVNAAWDPNSGKLVLTATDEGAVSINVTAGTGVAGEENASNFTDIMGLTTSTWDGSGKLESTALVEASQSLGTNAVLTINGTTITSASNTVTSDVSGIAGLTLTLNNTTSTTANVSVTQDTSKAITAITEFVSAFNTAISATDTALDAEDGNLYGESILKNLRNNIRKMVTSGTAVDDVYKTLASIGITTGKFSTDTSVDTNKLVIDTEELTKALTENPDAVKKLLIGDGTNAGVLSNLETPLTNALDLSKGYFAKREISFSKEVSNLNEKVTKMTDAMERYRTQLEAKFQAMDSLISSLKDSASVFDSYFSNTNKSDD